MQSGTQSKTFTTYINIYMQTQIEISKKKKTTYEKNAACTNWQIKLILGICDKNGKTICNMFLQSFPETVNQSLE